MSFEGLIEALEFMLDSCLGLMDLRVQMSYRALTKIEVHVCVCVKRCGLRFLQLLFVVEHNCG